MPVPRPGPGELRIRVQALGFNRAEALYRAGAYLESPEFPATPGYEASGTVDAVGEGVSAFRVGDPVGSIPAFSQNDYGVYATHALVPARGRSPSRPPHPRSGRRDVDALPDRLRCPRRGRPSAPR
ncbi:alcohol dehydrogenase catalytic domain-containing protein [Kitasatospora sp. NPDC004669]|uniref:alcohol dehydrogenase catalytic domain-containing protein n=1 Tax=Kitasatospora sp. NPDC004669 TaxID=3154555 RepID=UPI0033A23218